MNGGGSASLSSIAKGTDAMFIASDNTTEFGGAVTTGTNALTCGQLNSDNTRLDGNTLSTTNSNGDLLLTPNGTGGVALIATNAPGSYSFSAGTACNASGSNAVAIGDTAVASGNNTIALGDTVTASATGAVGIGGQLTVSGNYSTALGYRNSATRQGELSYASGYVAAAGDTKVAMFHNTETFSMSSSWQAIDSLGSYINLPTDSVGSGYCLFVGSQAGSAVSLGFRVDFIFENDATTHAIIQQATTSLDTQDTTTDARVAIVSEKLVAQVTDSSGTVSTRWSVFFQFVQHTYA